MRYPCPRTCTTLAEMERYEMAMKLYELENPNSSMKARKEAATKMARDLPMATEALYAERLRVNQRTLLRRPGGQVCQQACMAANPEALYQVERPIRTVEPVRRVAVATGSYSAWMERALENEGQRNPWSDTGWWISPSW